MLLLVSYIIILFVTLVKNEGLKKDIIRIMNIRYSRRVRCSRHGVVSALPMKYNISR